MQPLIVTITFLTLLSILVTGKMKEYFNHSIVATLDSNYKKMQEKVHEERQISLLHEMKDSEPESEGIDEKPKEKPISEEKEKENKHKGDGIPRSLQFNLARPPNHSRINFRTIIEDKKGKHGTYERAARLLRRLYGHMEFFQKIPQLEYKILDALKSKEEETKNFAFPDDLASLDLHDSQLQEAFTTMLKGYINCPSLLYYITFDPGHKKINFMFAPEAVLEAVIDDPKIMKLCLESRSFYWKLILNQEEHRKELLKKESFGRQRLKDEVTDNICAIFTQNGSSVNPKDLFDFSLSKEGTILIVTDPETLMTVREKISSKN